MSTTRWLKTLLLLIAVGPLSSTAFALELGDRGPELQVSSWVKGEPVKLSALKGKGVCVIEFWATWCGPCREGIPHLTELQHKYRDKGLVLVGITSESPEVVKPFVEQLGDKMDYRVAIDQRRGSGAAYMGGFGVQGIPHAFVMDKTGTIVWEGHPGEGLDEVVEQVLAGKYDAEMARNTAKARRLMEQYFHTVTMPADQAGDARKALKRARNTGESIIKLAAKNPSLLNEFAFTLLMAPELKNRDLDLAGKAAQAAYDASDKQTDDRLALLTRQYFHAVQSAATEKNDVAKTAAAQEQANKLADEIIELGKKSPTKLDDFAWTLLMSPALPQRDLKLATRVAETAYKATEGKNASILDTYAKAVFESGQREKAIELQRQAVAVNDDERFDARLKQTLKQYESAAKTE